MSPYPPLLIASLYAVLVSVLFVYMRKIRDALELIRVDPHSLNAAYLRVALRWFRGLIWVTGAIWVFQIWCVLSAATHSTL